MINDLATDQRVLKVCDFLHSNNYEVILIGRKFKNSLPVDHLPYSTKRFRMIFKKGALFYAFYNIRLFLFLLFRKTPHLLANDLDTLLANTLIKKIHRKTILYYDAHEYFTEVPEIINRKRVQNIWKKIERYCIPKVDYFYTVNQSIANLYNEKYGSLPKVVRNISSKKRIPKLEMKRTDIGLSDNDFLLILQGAGINIDRGAEEVVEAVSAMQDVTLLIVGSGDVIPQLKKEVEKKKVKNIHFIGKQPYEKLIQITQLADVGLTMDKDTNINYRFSLPNKIFDYLHSGLPIIASDLPEVKKIILENEIGLITDHKIENIQKAILHLKDQPGYYQKLKNNCLKTSEILTWENESEVLSEIYLNN